jgi:hypothetical protein
METDLLGKIGYGAQKNRSGIRNGFLWESCGLVTIAAAVAVAIEVAASAATPTAPFVTPAATASATVSAAPSTAAVTPSTAPSAITSAAFAGSRGTGFIDGQAAAFEIFAVKGADRGRGAGFVFHGDEGEAAGTARGPVEDDMNLADGSVLGEGVLEVVFSGLKGEIPHVELGAHVDILCSLLIYGECCLRCSRLPGFKSSPT